MKRRWDWCLLAGWTIALVMVRSASPSERDPYWQARDGLERWHGTALARTDSWSYAQPHGLFRPTSPGWNTALGLAYDAFGSAGIALVGAAGMFACIGIAIWLGRQLGARPLPSLVAGVLVAFLALQMLSPRATVAIQALLLASLALGHQIVRAPQTPASPWLRGSGMVLAGLAMGWLGAWIHVSWSVTAVGLAVALPLLAVLSGVGRGRILVATAAGAGLALGSWIGPYGPSVWALLLDVSSASDGEIVEWLPPFTEGLRSRWVPVSLLCIALVTWCAVRVLRRPLARPGSPARGRWALEVVLLVTSVVATLAGLFALRFLNVAAMTLFPVLAAEFSSVISQWRARPTRRDWVRERTGAAYWRPIFTGSMVILLGLSASNSRALGRPDPEAALARELPTGCHLFAPPHNAGAVLLVRPDVKVWLDMRTEVYGNSAYADMRRREEGTVMSLPQGSSCAMFPTAVHTVHLNGSADTWQRMRTLGGLTVWLPR